MSDKLGLLLVRRFVHSHFVITVVILHEVPPEHNYIVIFLKENKNI